MKYSPPRVGRYLIYGLLDPRDHCLRYVGKTHKRREIRLREHMENAVAGGSWPLHEWIRDLLRMGLQPVMFVLEKVPADGCWQEAEKRHIAFWRDFSAQNLPHCHPPQTIKSTEVLIDHVSLLNVRPGG